MKRWIIPVLVVAWAVAFFGSFLAFYLTPSRDFGLAAGWNRVSVLMQWQMVATGLAVASVVARRTGESVAMRRLALVPVGGVVLIALAIGALILFANMRVDYVPDPDAPAKPVTAPAESG